MKLVTRAVHRRGPSLTLLGAVLAGLVSVCARPTPRRLGPGLILALIAFIALGSPGRASAANVSPPVLQSVSVSPVSVDVSAASQSVTVTAQITDAVGLNSNWVATHLYGSYQVLSVELERTAGTAADGTYTTTLAMPVGAASGTWALDYMSLTDLDGNNVLYGPGGLSWPSGSTTTLTVTDSHPNLTPPVLQSLAVSPGSVDVSAGSQSLDVTAQIADSMGVSSNWVQTYLYSESSSQQLSVDLERTAGTATDGTYTATVTMPTGAASGSWTLNYMSLWDVDGNNVLYGPGGLAWPAGSSSSLTVIDTQPNLSPPVLQAITVSPGSVDVSASSQPVKVTAQITSSSGLAGSTVNTYLASSASSQVIDLTLSRSSGSATAGTYTGTATIPQNAAGGTWSLGYLVLTDTNGNSAQYGSGGRPWPTGSTTQVSVTTSGTPCAVEPPVAVTASPGIESATLGWVAPGDACPVLSFAVGQAGGPTITLPGTATTDVVSNLIPGTSYSFTIVAQTAYGNAAAAPVSVVPTAPPSGGSGSGSGSGSGGGSGSGSGSGGPGSGTGSGSGSGSGSGGGTGGGGSGSGGGGSGSGGGGAGSGGGGSASSGSGAVRLPAGDYVVQNAAGGIYWRSSPNWNTPIKNTHSGFHPGTVIRVVCYESGDANVPGSKDSMWEQASWVGGPGSGSGWINEHFIDDGSPINRPSPGAKPCGKPVSTSPAPGGKKPVPGQSGKVSTYKYCATVPPMTLYADGEPPSWWLTANTGIKASLCMTDVDTYNGSSAQTRTIDPPVCPPKGWFNVGRGASLDCEWTSTTRGRSGTSTVDSATVALSWSQTIGGYGAITCYFESEKFTLTVRTAPDGTHTASAKVTNVTGWQDTEATSVGE